MSSSGKALRWRRGGDGRASSPRAPTPAGTLDETWLRETSIPRADGAAPLREHVALLARGALHLRGFLVDPSPCRRLREELLNLPEEPWSAHGKLTRPPGGWPPTVQEVFASLRNRFDVVRIVETRVNVYRSGDWKPLHRDRNAHDASAGDVTVGFSFGACRDLVFAADPAGPPLFRFRQRSGDVFAFDAAVNAAFFSRRRPQWRRDRRTAVEFGSLGLRRGGGVGLSTRKAA
jgi:hypothetical protein